MPEHPFDSASSRAVPVTAIRNGRTRTDSVAASATGPDTHTRRPATRRLRLDPSSGSPPA